MTARALPGVSFVVPVHNGVVCIRQALEAILAQADGRPFEIIVVDDGSTDGSLMLLRRLAAKWPLRIISADGRGAAAAINDGIRAARHPYICQVDQDVVLSPGWMTCLLQAMSDPDVAAAQGCYFADRRANWTARVMGLDLAQRYHALNGSSTEHVCTGNAIYRADALHRAGLFDESFGYGYDNDMSYRLRDAGHRLVICREARSLHHWREGFLGYLSQQYGYGYGRLDLVAKHPRRLAGDSVSPAPMMSHPLVMAAVALALAAAAVMTLTGGPARLALIAAIALLGALALERLVAGALAWRRFGDPLALAFVPLHLARDAAWVAAMAIWMARRLLKQEARPSHSMRPRPAHAPFDLDAAAPVADAGDAVPLRVLGLIPAYNEVSNLAAVIAEVRAECPTLDLLVLDDGSTDATAPMLQDLGVSWLRFPERLGIGSAMRAGLRYAARTQYDAAIRIDGDGQHRADDIHRLLTPIRNGEVDVVLGSRYESPDGRSGAAPILKKTLGVCLSALTGTRVTDPTSGFCAIGPRALQVLADHHPTGYPEPELRLFLKRNSLSAIEVPVRARSRFSGRTTLTAGRFTTAAARVLLAMVIVPLRGRIEGRP